MSHIVARIISHCALVSQHFTCILILWYGLSGFERYGYIQSKAWSDGLVKVMQLQPQAESWWHCIHHLPYLFITDHLICRIYYNIFTSVHIRSHHHHHHHHPNPFSPFSVLPGPMLLRDPEVPGCRKPHRDFRNEMWWFFDAHQEYESENIGS